MTTASIRRRLEKLERAMNPDRTVIIAGQPYEVGTLYRDRFLVRYDEVAKLVEYQAYRKGVKASKTCTPAAWVKWAGHEA